MDFAIVCHGCGARVTVPENYARNKMQCPECGVLCEVPPRPAGPKKAKERPAAEDAARVEDEKPVAPVRAAAPPPVTTFLKEPVPAGEGLITCPHCGEMVRAPARKRGKPGKCPVCATAWAAPAAPPKPPPPVPKPVPPPPDEFAGSSPDEDPDSGNPYRTASAPVRRCPGCSMQLEATVVVCVRCGFDMREGRKHVKEYQKIERTWDSGLTPKRRRILFGVGQVLALNAIIVGFLTVEDSAFVAVPTLFVSWAIFTALTAFLLGTYDHCEMKRFKSGRIDLLQTWRYGFIPWPTQKIDVREYFDVIARVTAHDGIWEWFMCLFLVGFGIFPAAIYWYCVIHKTEYNVVLSNDIRNLELYVYRGWNQEQMHEIAEMLRDAMTV